MAGRHKYDRPAGGQRRFYLGIPRNSIEDGSEYTSDEVEFMMAVDRYKRENRRPFPTWSEIFAVFVGLGYRKSRTPLSACTGMPKKIMRQAISDDKRKYNRKLDRKSQEIP